MERPRRSSPVRVRCRFDTAWIFGAVGIILAATLPPQPEWPGADRQILGAPLPGSRAGWFDVAQNIALYAPLGLVLGANGWRLLHVCSAATLIALATELVQFVIPGRSPTLRDVFVNGAGALTGYAIWRSPLGRSAGRARSRVESWCVLAYHADRRRASRLSLVWGAGVGVILTATAALLTPALPRFGSSVASPYLDRNLNPLRIGTSGAAGGFFNGLIDEVRVFNRPRPEALIRDDMQTPVAQSGRAQRQEGLVAAFGLDAGRGAVAHDDSGRNHDGQVRLATWVDRGRVGGALAFDGVSSEVVVPYAPGLELSDGMTLEAWVRPSAEPAGEPGIISRAGAYHLDVSSSEAGFHGTAGGRFGGVFRYARLVDPIPRDEWTHLATTYDGQVIRLYVNGTLTATQTHWSPHRPERARLNAADLRAGIVDDPEGLRRMLLGEVDLEVSVRCGVFSDTAAPLFMIGALQNKPVLTLDAAGRSLIVRPWTWAANLMPAFPPIQVPDALGSCAPTRTIALALRGRLQNPRVSRDGETLAADVPGLGSTWAFAFHAELFPIWLQTAATCACLTLLAVPLGFWGRPTAASAMGIALAAAAAFTAPYTLHVRPLNTGEIGMLLAGAIAGAIYGRFMQRAD